MSQPDVSRFMEQLLDGVEVEWKAIWEVTVWDKKFNAVENYKQPKVSKYRYFLAKEFRELIVEGGNVKLLTTNISNLYTTEERAGDDLCEGEIVAIPWGGNAVVQYFKGKFLTSDNRIATSIDMDYLNNKFLYYYLLNNLALIESYYRGSGIKHPSMSDILDMQIPIPSIEAQAEIVRILDAFTAMTTELTTELNLRKKQYNHYRDQLLSFEEGEVERKTLGVISEINTGQKPSEILNVPTEFDYINAGTTRSGYASCSNCEGDTVTTPSRGQGGIGFVGFQKEPFWLGPLCYKMRSVDKEILINKYLFYFLQSKSELLLGLKKEGGVPAVNKSDLAKLEIPVPTVDKQKRIVAILDKFDALTNSITEGLPREIELRQKQYEYYRDLLLSFPKPGSEVAA